MKKIKKLGSIYFDGHPASPGEALAERQFSIGDTCFGMELQWVIDDGLMIADRAICTNITWEQLDYMGLAFGTPICIDGKVYLCRCLKVGSKEGVPNEWDHLLDKYGEDNKLWHWKATWFWGQETVPGPGSLHPLRGWMPARRWCYDSATYQSVEVGFRPALEPIINDPVENLVGSNIKVFGPRGEYVKGRLIGGSDYDLVVDAAGGFGDGIGWTRRLNGPIIIKREVITKIWEMEV